MPQIGFVVPTNRMTSTSVGQLKTTFCWVHTRKWWTWCSVCINATPSLERCHLWGTTIESDSQWECFIRMKEIKSCTSFIVTGSLSPTICNCLEKHWKTSQEHYQLVTTGGCPLQMHNDKNRPPNQKVDVEWWPRKNVNRLHCLSGALSLTFAMHYTLDGRNPAPMRWWRKTSNCWKGKMVMACNLLSQSIRRQAQHKRYKRLHPKSEFLFRNGAGFVTWKVHTHTHHIIHPKNEHLEV